MRILLGGNFPNIRILAAYLRATDHLVDMAESGQDIIDFIDSMPLYDAVLLGTSMPDMSLKNSVKAARRLSCSPVIILQPQGLNLTSSERTSLLAEGAACILQNPGNHEVLAQITSLLNLLAHQASNVWYIGNLEVDMNTFTVKTREGVDIVLPRREFDILAIFIRARGSRLSKESIYMRLYDIMERDRVCGTNVVESHISKLSKKLDTYNTGIRIESTRFQGYMLIENRPQYAWDKVPYH